MVLPLKMLTKASLVIPSELLRTSIIYCQVSDLVPEEALKSRQK